MSSPPAGGHSPASVPAVAKPAIGRRRRRDRVLGRARNVRRLQEQWGLADPRPPLEHFEIEPWAQPALPGPFPVHVAGARSHADDSVEARLLRTEDAA